MTVWEVSPVPPGRLRKAAAFAVAGASIVFGVAIFGHSVGQKASARVAPGPEWNDVLTPSNTVVAKSSLLRGSLAEPVDQYGQPVRFEQQVQTGGKGDFIVELASVPKHEDRIAQVETLIFSPPAWQLEKVAQRAFVEKKKIEVERKRRYAEFTCMAKAIYFEARGESTLGQMAVANVIMNRVKSKNYPSSICGVVYQNKHWRNKCQFSFACDGHSDKPRPGRHWGTAKRIANQFVNGKKKVYAVQNATHYHADYVNPNWSRSLKRVKKIGRHIFYASAG